MPGAHGGRLPAAALQEARGRMARMGECVTKTTMLCHKLELSREVCVKGCLGLAWGAQERSCSWGRGRGSDVRGRPYAARWGSCAIAEPEGGGPNPRPSFMLRRGSIVTEDAISDRDHEHSGHNCDCTARALLHYSAHTRALSCVAWCPLPLGYSAACRQCHRRYFDRMATS